MKWLLRTSAIGTIAYIAFCTMIYIMQPSMIFYPNMPGRELVSTPESIGLNYQDVELTTEDKIKLHSWFIAANTPSPTQKTVLLFHGNAGNISHRLDSINIFHKLGLNVFIIDYRGYGQSTGEITETGMYLDSKAAWFYLTKQRGINADNIIIFGRSLGGSVAAWLASQYTPAALIIESSFSSVASMGKRFYPYLPVSLISRYDFDTKKHTETVNCPVLIAHSLNDDIIPYEEGRDIFKTAPEPKQFLQMQGGHNDGFIVSGKDYVSGLQSFIFGLDSSNYLGAVASPTHFI